MENSKLIIFLLVASSAFGAHQSKGVPGKFVKCKVVSFDQEKINLFCNKKKRFIPRSKVKSDLTEGSVVTVLTNDFGIE